MLTFHHAPWSRSSAIFWLIEELGIDYRMELVDIRAPGGVPEAYRAVQPNKKVPAIVHDGVTVTERAAIAIHLADAFPAAGLAPAIGDPARGPYLTWLVYCDSVFDPAVSARAHGLAYRSNDYSFGLFEDLVANLERRLTAHRFAAGDAFTAADTQLASAMHFTMKVMAVLPSLPVFEDYVARATDRPAWRRAQARDAELAAANPWMPAS